MLHASGILKKAHQKAVTSVLCRLFSSILFFLFTTLYLPLSSLSFHSLPPSPSLSLPPSPILSPSRSISFCLSLSSPFCFPSRMFFMSLSYLLSIPFSLHSSSIPLTPVENIFWTSIYQYVLRLKSDVLVDPKNGS